MSFGERLRTVRIKSNLKQVDFAEALHVTSAYISRLELGKANPSDMFISSVGFIFHINEEWLRTGEGRMESLYDATYKKLQSTAGEDNQDLRRHQVKLELHDSQIKELQRLFAPAFPRLYDMIEVLAQQSAAGFVMVLNVLIKEWAGRSNEDRLRLQFKLEDLIPDFEVKKKMLLIAREQEPDRTDRRVSKVMVPVVGRAAAGTPIEMIVNDLGSIAAGDEVRVGDFGIIAAGDSMIDVGIMDGDLCIIRPQETIENGEIALVAVDDSSTIKKFYRENGHYRLVACNSEYKDQVYPASAPVRILGKFIKVARRV